MVETLRRGGRGKGTRCTFLGHGPKLHFLNLGASTSSSRSSQFSHVHELSIKPLTQDPLGDISYSKHVDIGNPQCSCYTVRKKKVGYSFSQLLLITQCGIMKQYSQFPGIIRQKHLFLDTERQIARDPVYSSIFLLWVCKMNMSQRILRSLSNRSKDEN